MNHASNAQQGVLAREPGFSIIELTIALAIMAVLAAVALPTYKDFSIRSKVAECISSSAPPRLSITMYRDQTGHWPKGAQELSLATTGSVTGNGTGIGPYCSELNHRLESSAEGTYQLIVDGAAVDPSLSLAMIAPDMVPRVNADGVIAWDCRSGDTDAGFIRYLPEECRD